jgi:hypothetical protein
MNNSEVEQVANSLKKLPAGFVPYPIFEEIARIIALPILEIIPLRKDNNGSVEVLLIERGEDDPLWPGTLHTPGTVIRATDVHQIGKNNWPALQRILNDELNGTAVGPLQYFGSMLHASKRGVEQAQLYWVNVTEEPRTGKFYPVNNLPSQLIDSQTDFIRLAAEKFKEMK